MAATSVLVHSDGHGGCCYQSVARSLRAKNHDLIIMNLNVWRNC